MKIGIAGPIDLSLLTDLFPAGQEIPKTYSFALTAALAREFYNRGHEIVLFALSSEVTATRRLDGDRITAYICQQRRPRLQMLDFFRAERQELRDAMRRSGCDVIHAHWTYEFGSAAVESGLPHVVTAHDTPVTVLRFARHPYWVEKPWMALPVLRRAQCVTAVSPYLAGELERFFRPQRDIVVVPNGLPPEVFEMGNRSGDNGERTFSFGSILNGFEPRKNAKGLLKAFARVRTELVGQVELFMIGSGFEKGGPAEQWARDHRADDGVHFMGPRPHSEVLETLANGVDALVHPALEETFCMAALEAMAIGVPIIGGNKSGAVPWLLDGGKCGALVDVRSVRDLSAAMVACFRDRKSFRRRAALARVAARERFSITGVVDSYERLCQSQLQ